MDAFTFRFKNVSSKEYGIYGTLVDAPINTPRRTSHKRIDFRDGVYDFENNMFDPQVLTLECFFTSPVTRHQLREVTLWLTGKAELILDTEPDKHYKATVYDRADLDAIANRAFGKSMANGKFTVTWFCADPFAYSDQTVMPVQAGYNYIDYKGTASTPTLIILRNTGDAPLSSISVHEMGMM